MPDPGTVLEALSEVLDLLDDTEVPEPMPIKTEEDGDGRTVYLNKKITPYLSW